MLLPIRCILCVAFLKILKYFSILFHCKYIIIESYTTIYLMIKSSAFKILKVPFHKKILVNVCMMWGYI